MAFCPSPNPTYRFWWWYSATSRKWILTHTNQCVPSGTQTWRAGKVPIYGWVSHDPCFQLPCCWLPEGVYWNIRRLKACELQFSPNNLDFLRLRVSTFLTMQCTHCLQLITWIETNNSDMDVSENGVYVRKIAVLIGKVVSLNRKPIGLVPSSSHSGRALSAPFQGSSFYTSRCFWVTLNDLVVQTIFNALWWFDLWSKFMSNTSKSTGNHQFVAANRRFLVDVPLIQFLVKKIPKVGGAVPKKNSFHEHPLMWFVGGWSNMFFQRPKRWKSKITNLKTVINCCPILFGATIF